MSDASEVAHLRVPPHSVEAEQSVLACLLLDNGSWDKVADVITEGDFYRHEHRRIFWAAGSLIGASKPADIITVFDKLEGLGRNDVPLAYLNELAHSVPSAASARRYAEIVRERAVLRKVIAAGDEMATAAFNPQGRSVSQILDSAEASVFAIGEEGARKATGMRSMDGLAIEFIDRLTELHENGGSDVTGVRTSFYEIDRMTAGMQAGDLIVLAARPSMGKTAFALNIAENVAIREGLPVIIFSMEMGASQLTQRMIGSVGSIHQSALRTGRLKDEDWGRLTEAVDKISKASLFIDETPALMVAELRARARRQARISGKLGLIVIDYLQLMGTSASASEENRATAIGEISRGLKGLAKELQCPIIALSQLNRSVESRTDKRPMMSDLRESGAIEQDADVIMFIYRDDYYNKDSKDPGVAEIIISKQRCGPVGTVRLAFQKHLTKFGNLASD